MPSSTSSAPDPAGSETRLREFRFPDDYQSARSLWANAGPGIHVRRSDEPEEIRKKLQRDPDLFLVAEAEGRIVGTVIGGFDGRRGMIYHLAVESGFRKRGVGGVLMEEVERRLRAKGCLKVYLLVTTDNQTAIDFYKSRGWEHMDDLFIFGKEL